MFRFWILPLLMLEGLLLVGCGEELPKDTEEPAKDDLLVLSLVSERTDSHSRLLRSAKVAQLDVQVLQTKPDTEQNSGSKIDIITSELAKHKASDGKIVMIVDEDGYDALISGSRQQLLEAFVKTKARVLLAADPSCQPDTVTCSLYPTEPNGVKRYVNARAMVGYVDDLLALFTHLESLQQQQQQQEADLQLLLSRLYLDDTLRQKFGLRLDTAAVVFQNLDGAAADVELRFRGAEAYLQNTLTNTAPLVLLASRSSTGLLNTLANYLAGAWNPQTQCSECWTDQIEMGNKPDTFPRIFLAVFIEQPTPFMEEFLKALENVIYPRSKLDVYIHSAVEYHAPAVREWAERLGSSCRSVKLVPHTDKLKEWHARNNAVEECLKSGADFYFSVDSTAHLDNPYILKLLIEQNRDILAPMLVRPFKAWSNFWGSVTTDGFYDRSFDYMDIVQGKHRGLWNVPYISACYLIKRNVLENEKTRPNYINNLMDPDMAFCTNMRNAGKFMFVTNRLTFGHLVSADGFNTSRLHSELWQISTNRWDWERRYLHPNYSTQLKPDVKNDMPCPDVYRFPVVTERFCHELVEIMEHYGKWSDGSHQDPRIEGGYESVPTRDIHMKQVGYDKEWLAFLATYVRPLQEKVFPGYAEDEPPSSHMNFVVRYRPDEQASLVPHHDASTYTINIALNTAGLDYQGGGCRFVRYNCSVTDSQKGWMLLHPGRLTHQHEGLPTTQGTRYIMISFIDP